MYAIMEENKSKGDVIMPTHHDKIIFNGGKTKECQKLLSQPVEVKAWIQAAHISRMIHIPVRYEDDVQHLAADYDIRKMRDLGSKQSRLGNIYENICSMDDVVNMAVDGRLFGVKI